MSVADRFGPISPVRRGRRLVSILAVLVVWVALTSVGGGISNLPSPMAVATGFADAITEPAFWAAAVQSTFRIYLSFAVAAALAIPLGLLIGWSLVFGDFLFPSFEMLRPVPPVAWIPVVSLAFPYVPLVIVDYPINTGILFITFLGAFFPILLNAIEGTRGIDEEYSRAARSLGSSPAQTFRHIVYPGALPSIHAGMINGMGLAWVNLVAAEMIAGTGLGYLTWSSYIAGDYPTIIVGMVSIGILGSASSFLVRQIGERQLGWADTS